PRTPLSDLLHQGKDPTGAARTVARALATLHLDRVATMRQHCLQEELALLRRVGNLIRWACPHLAEKVETVVGTLDARLTEASRGPTHRDLKADHILLDGNRLALVDLDSFGQ